MFVNEKGDDFADQAHAVFHYFRSQKMARTEVLPTGLACRADREAQEVIAILAEPSTVALFDVGRARTCTVYNLADDGAAARVGISCSQSVHTRS